MPIKVNPSSDGKKSLTISVEGRFDYSLHKTFREAYMQSPVTTSEYIVDLSTTEYMDSSALGMLLLLKEHAEKQNAKVSLHDPQPLVRKVLEIANFKHFFPIH